MKTCKQCGARKPDLDFHRKRSTLDGLDNYCKVCHAARRGRVYTGVKRPAADHPLRHYNYRRDK